MKAMAHNGDTEIFSRGSGKLTVSTPYSLLALHKGLCSRVVLKGTRPRPRKGGGWQSDFHGSQAILVGSPDILGTHPPEPISRVVLHGLRPHPRKGRGWIWPLGSSESFSWSYHAVSTKGSFGQLAEGLPPSHNIVAATPHSGGSRKTYSRT